LLLNDGQDYTLRLRAEWRTRTLVAFFAPGLVEQVAAAVAQSEDRMLDDPKPALPGRAGFIERLYPKTGVVGCAMARLDETVRTWQIDSLRLEACFYDIAAATAELDSGVRREIRRLPWMRAATREELYRRLHAARDFLHSCYDQPLRIADLARVAHLAPYHFLHTYKAAFGSSPMHDLQRRRLNVAADLLATSEMPVTSICLDVGFESPSTFSGLFRSAFGQSPRAYRLLLRRRRHRTS